MSLLKSLKNLTNRATFAVAVVALAAVAAHAQQTTAPRPSQTPPPRTQQQLSPQGQQYGQPGFIGEAINLNVVKADIRDIFNHITEQYGVNFVIDKSVGQVPVTVNLSDVPWNIALDAILRANGLGVDVQGSILRVADAKLLADETAVRRQIEDARLDTEQLYTEIIQLNYARASGTLGGAAGDTGGFTGGATSQGVSSSSGGDVTGGGADTGIMPIIKRRLSRRGGIEVDGRGNRLIVTDVRRNIDSIRQLVAFLDQPEPQVEIEVRIVIAQRNFLREIGVQLGATVRNPFDRGGFISGQTGSNINNPPTGTLVLTTGAFGTAQITAALNLAETKGQARIVATPRVTALNNRPAQIESGSQIPVTTIQPNGGGEDQLAVFTTTFVSVPLRLSVTPQITDAGTVILRVVAENNSVNSALANGLSGTPGIDTQRMQTEVLVPDGGTTVVGGVLTDSENESRSRTPGLASIPLLGNLFKNRATQRNTAEILFFITPRIYRPDFRGNPTNSVLDPDGNRSNTVLQPVPLGNPPSNTSTPQVQPPTGQPNVVVPQQQTTTTTIPQPRN
ncbi:MAG TPA: type IV pilus secretin PilQ [Pyrinomonadaceae bacterium]|jgi:type IV pilus assembly protein PilQ